MTNEQTAYAIDAFNVALAAFRKAHPNAERVTPTKFALETFLEDSATAIEQKGADLFFSPDVRSELETIAAVCIRLEHIKYARRAL